MGLGALVEQAITSQLLTLGLVVFIVGIILGAVATVLFRRRRSDR